MFMSTQHICLPRSESKGRHSFIVADTETVLVNDVHVPYAAGFLVVKPGDGVGAKPDHSIESRCVHLTKLVMLELRSLTQLINGLC
jgi:hypothetical protein